MAIDQIVEGIRNAPLAPEVQERAIAKILEASDPLEKMFESLRYKSLNALPGWYLEITHTAMSIITPTLREANVAERDGQNTYSHIYVKVACIKEDEQGRYFV